jgi:hypothetical protein
MTLREQFINYVKHGGAPICSPQIGAGAGFDTKLAGKAWLHETTLEDTLQAVSMFDIVPLINIGLPDLALCNPALAWKETAQSIDGDRARWAYALETPHGTLTQQVISEKRKGGCRTEAPVKSGEELDAVEWWIDTALECDLAPVTAALQQAVAQVGDRGAISVQWPVQPYEIFGFPDTVTTVFLALDYPEQFKRLMDKILLLDYKLFVSVAATGADFIFLGGPAKEMISPAFYEKFIIPYSQQATEAAHAAGLLVYSHICSPIEPFLTMGFYNRMGIDLFETLSPPPVGNVASIKDALSKLNPAICTRGNIGLDVLMNATPEIVREQARQILADSKGRKHILAASDYLFYDVPAENVEAMAEAARTYKDEV